MRIEDGFDYNASYDEIADEFCKNDSDYQGMTINEIGLQFKIWSQDNKRKTAIHEQFLMIVEHLDEDGKWFIKTLCEYMNNGSENILNAIAFIESRASSDFSCMHPMSKDDFVKRYSSEIMDAAFKYYENQYESAREKFQNDKKKG